MNADPPAEPNTFRRSSRFKHAACFLLTFPPFAGALFYNLAMSAGSSFEEGKAFALIFGIFGAVFFFPLLIATGFLIRWIIEKCCGDRIRYRTAVAWFAHVPLTILMFVTSLQPTSTTDYYRRFVSDDVPESLDQFQVWHTSGFGNSRFIVAFEIEPTDFPKLLTRHEFEEADPPDEREPLADRLRKRDPSFPIKPINEPWAHCFIYSKSKITISTR
ncbi:MAG: hypothetical protein R3F11_00885 [Verrucomicrobiales bacterium]